MSKGGKNFSRRRHSRHQARASILASGVSPRALALLAALAALPLGPEARLAAQTNFTEAFTGTTAPGWIFGANPGDSKPFLTAATGAGGYDSGGNAIGAALDTAGNGWLRLNTNTNNQSTFALLDTQIFSVNARIEIEMEFAFFNGTGADGITFFLVDGAVNSSTFAPGAYGGSMGYANRTGEAGMAGGYLGFALDTFGNYSNDEEGRNGGYASGLRPNNVVVRGPESSGWAYIDDSGDLAAFDFNGAAPGGTGQTMSFYGSSTRPVQTGSDYRQFRIVIDANNQLSVDMRFGVGNNYVTVLTSDLSAFERPDTFKIGFTGATGGATGIHEIRQLEVTTTPWSVADGGYEWDRGAGTTTWGDTPGAANTNWFTTGTGNNQTPLAVGANSGTYPGADILFGNKPTQTGTTGGPRSGPAVLGDTETVNLGSTSTSVRSLTFDTGLNYVVNGTGIVTLGNGTGSSPQNAGIGSINVNDYNGVYGLHKVNVDLSLAEAAAIRNYSYSVLCINGDYETNGHTTTTTGYGAVNFNGDISGSGDLVVNGSAIPYDGPGIVTINNNNSDDPTGTPTAWSGDVVVNRGQLVLTENGALGTSTGTTTVNSGGTLTLRSKADGTSLAYTSTESITLNGTGATLGRGELAGALYNDGGNNSLGTSVTIALASDSSIGSRAGNLTINGTISGSTRVLTKTGEGVVTLTNGSNGNTGGTTIAEGALRIQSNTGALNGGFSGSSGGNLNLAGGVLEIGADSAGTATLGTFQRDVGTGDGKVSWSGDGGFSAHGFNATVNLSGGGKLTWASGSFVQDGRALLLSSDYSNATVTLANPLRLNNAQREIRVADGSAAVDGVLSGRIRGDSSNNDGSGGIIKTGAGTLELSATNNGYGGATEIRAGALRGTVGTASNIQLQGGVRELNADYTSNLGTTGGLLRWINGGGLAADTADRTFNVGNNGQTLTWGGNSGNSQRFVRAGSELVLGSRSTSATLVFANAINLGGARTIRVQDGVSAFTGAEARITQAINNGTDTGSLTVRGNGRLDLTAANGYTGATTLVGAEVRLANTSGALASTSIALSQGASLVLDSTSGTNNTARVADTAAISLAGSSVVMRGSTDNSTRENLGALTLSSGANTLDVLNAGTGDAALSFSSIARSAGATLDIVRPNASSDVQFRTASSGTNLNDDILAWATANGSDFVTHGGANTDLAAYTYADLTAAANLANWSGATFNASTAAASSTQTADRTVNSLRLVGGADLVQAGFSITIESGGLLTTGGTSSSVISGGTVTTGAGGRELVVHAHNTVGTEISSVIAGTGDLTKTGNGDLTLSGTSANTYSGTTTVNSGTLALAKTGTGANSVAVTGNLVIGDGRGIDTVRLDGNEQIANSATVTLRGGEVGNGNHVARLVINGATTDGAASRSESFATLSIQGNSILDFSGGTVCSPNFLRVNVLDVASDGLLTIANWIDLTDYLLVSKASFDATDMPRVIFEGYGGSAAWKEYDSTYWQIVPFTPVPEPASFGVLALGGLTAFAGLRRRHRA